MTATTSLSSTLAKVLRITPPVLLAKAWSRFAVDHDIPAEPALPAESHTIETTDGKLTYYATAHQRGRPVVLIHGIHAAASAYDVRPLFESIGRERRVVAPDLPGFGLSDRSARSYAPETYVRAIEHVLRDVAAIDGADVVALSLSAEFAAQVAADVPSLVHSLTLISPTGFAAEREMSRLERAARAGKHDHGALMREVLGEQTLYDMLVSQPSLHFFLRRSFAGPVDPELQRYAYKTSHRPGARHAPLDFVSGALFPAGDPVAVYGAVHQPALVMYDRDGFVGFGKLEAFAREHPNFELARIAPSRGLPHFEKPDTALDVLHDFWERARKKHGHAA